jgi:hypothetical protein
MSAAGLWTYRDTTSVPPNIIGYSIEAIDGSIGKIDEASTDVGASYLVVDTGPWIFGKRVLIPAGIVDRVDAESETVYVNRTKEEIENAPELDPVTYREPTYRELLGTYYGFGGPGYRGFGIP